MKRKVILVIMDGVGYDTALSHCGFLEGMVEFGRARRWLMRASLPTVSAAMYETLHTGLPPIDHGVVGNEALRPSIRECRASGRVLRVRAGARPTASCPVRARSARGRPATPSATVLPAAPGPATCWRRPSRP